jgi:predicted DnaQ family exonuclease/DinG family helicase
VTATYVALDVEATGMDPERDDIIEVAAIKFRDDRVIDRWESLVRPRGSVPFNIALLTGLTTQDVKRAPAFAAVAPRLKAFVQNHPIVGQSPEFDIGMLEGAGLRLQNPRYDTFALATILLPDLPAYNLATIAARLGVSVPAQHRAMADVETTMAVFLALRSRLEHYDPGTLDQLASFARVSGSPLARLFSEVRRETSGGRSLGGELGPLAHALAEAGGVAQGPEVMFLMQRDRPSRLEPTGEGGYVDPLQLRAWAAPDGALARSFPGFEPRPQQTEMMESVATAFNRGEHLLVEAGTGTGKSLAYLLPAVIHAVRAGEPVVVSTDTIALQDQLFRKDLPDLRATLRRMSDVDPEIAHFSEFKAALLKGRSNYLCLRRWFLAQREAITDPAVASLYAKVLTWVQETETGDRVELHLAPDEQPQWGRLSEDEGACLPGRCVFHRRNQCFLFRARHNAESAHVIVVNHSLLLSDMLAENRVLPPYRHLIVDEAHNLEEEATQQLGYSVSRNRLLDLIRRIVNVEDSDAGGILVTLNRAVRHVSTQDARAIASELQSRVETAETAARGATARIDELFNRLRDFVTDYQRSDRSGYDRRLRLTPAVRHDPGWSEIEVRWEEAASLIRRLLADVQWAARSLDRLDDDELPGYDDNVTELDLLTRTGDEVLRQTLSTVSEPDPEVIYWLSQHVNSQEVSCHTAPLNVGHILREQLFDPCETVLLTSATMTIDGSFDYVRDRLGADRAQELKVSSPFNYPESTLLYLADDIPQPGHPGHQRELQQALFELCRATRGRAMVLFTSHNALQNAYRAIKRPLESDGVLVLAQRLDGNPRQLVERLKSHEATVLMGTNSFWEGVDIVGDALSLLVITKLPFSVPSDPVFAARSELFDDPFHQYAVPQAVLRFKQGFGRLIRSSTDTGVCAVLDQRIITRRYGASFVDSLPECTVVRGSSADLPRQAATWLSRQQSKTF